jgi:PTH1 family peptidyl-tRNA hydrolase
LVIVGLGNPGAKYENTRHNVGFVTVDRLAERHGISVRRLRHKALVGEGALGAGKKALLVKPQTYMNDSGVSVREVASFFKVEPAELCVVYDDIDIPAGALRIRMKGSAGTHNGMRSIIYQLGYDDFPRFRIGIGPEKGEDRGPQPLRDFVLSGFAAGEMERMRAAVDRCVDALELWASEGIEAAMQRYNG